MKFIDLFAGIGGFRYGLENAEGCGLHNKKWGERKQDRKTRLGFDCVWSNEWDKYASSIYRRHYGEINTEDIRTIDADKIPDHDLLCAGFPCQAFSVAGKRRGFEDTRGTLFFEVARIARDKQPSHLLLENVKGLLSHEDGRTFHTILRVLADLGYRVEWQVLNSKHFGVPQNRERVFIIGHSRKECGRQVFPIRETNPKNLREITKGESQGMRVYEPDGISTTLLSSAGGLGTKTGLYAITRGRSTEPWSKGEVAPTLVASDLRKGYSGQNKQFYEKTGMIRRLTPTECERLQSFPDNWTKYGVNKDGEQEEISDTQRYKCLGNAVTTSVITAIGTKLLNKRKESE